MIKGEVVEGILRIFLCDCYCHVWREYFPTRGCIIRLLSVPLVARIVVQLHERINKLRVNEVLYKDIFENCLYQNIAVVLICIGIEAVVSAEIN